MMTEADYIFLEAPYQASLLPAISGTDRGAECWCAEHRAKLAVVDDFCLVQQSVRKLLECLVHDVNPGTW